jgi:hypothetical protein
MVELFDALSAAFEKATVGLTDAADFIERFTASNTTDVRLKMEQE